MLDTCVAIDLNVNKVEFIEEFLNCLGDDEIYISSVNFGEIKDPTIATILRKSKKVHIIQNNESEFIAFLDEIEPLGINLTNNDAHVLFLAKKQSADYVVSSDLNVFKQTNNYKKCMKYTYMTPFTTVLLLKYLYTNGKIKGSDFFEKTLYLFKNKEIDNVLDHMIRYQNLNCVKAEQINIVNMYKRTLKERFEMYREPIVNEFRYIWSLRIQT